MSQQEITLAHPENMPAIRDVALMLELRISVETDAAALAAERRKDGHLQNMKQALDDFDAAIGRGENAVDADYRFHLLIAQATCNPYFERAIIDLSQTTIPRTRLNTMQLYLEQGLNYLNRTNTEHRQIYDAIRRSNPEAARNAMRLHLLNSLERLRLASATAEQD